MRRDDDHSHAQHDHASERSHLDPFIVVTGDAPPRDQRDLMERPFFSLGKRPRLKPILYRTADVEVQVFAMVRLQNQSERDLAAFEGRARDWPLVRECHMLNGEIDFILKCVAPDLSSFQHFLTHDLTAAPNVASVKTSLVIRCAKDEPGVPFAGFEPRPEAS